MSDAKIKVIIKRPDEKAGHVTNISASLKNLQKTVEGNIETVTVVLDPKVIMICNEEGKILGLEKNFCMGTPPFHDVIVGTVILCGVNEEWLADVPIDFKMWKFVIDNWNS